MPSQSPTDRKPEIPFFGESRRVFIAGMLVNTVYLTVAAAFASNFFEKFNPVIKMVMVLVIILFAIATILLYPSVTKEKGV